MIRDAATVDTSTDTARSRSNAEVIEETRAHHLALAAQLHERTWALLTTAKNGDCAIARHALHAWYRDELMPHIVAEEHTLYSAASDVDATRLLVCSMLTEHRTMVSMIADLALAREPFETAMIAASTQTLLTSHLGKENDLLLPALGTAGVDLAVLISGLHEIVGVPAGSTDVCDCGCGDEAAGDSVARVPVEITAAPSDEPPSDPTLATVPHAADELDVRTLPHGKRHEIIFGRLDALALGQELVIVNDHDPKPLRYQTEALFPDRFEWTYRETGPQVWRVAITRAA